MRRARVLEVAAPVIAGAVVLATLAVTTLALGADPLAAPSAALDLYADAVGAVLRTLAGWLDTVASLFLGA